MITREILINNMIKRGRGGGRERQNKSRKTKKKCETVQMEDDVSDGTINSEKEPSENEGEKLEREKE